MNDDPITEDWLKASGFKWHQHDRQTGKHWLLWMGDTGGRHSGFEDIGIEVATMRYKNSKGDTLGDDAWFVWLRSDTAGRYYRFIHVRHMRLQIELVRLVEAISGQVWDTDNHFYGAVMTQERAARYRQDEERFDQRVRAMDKMNEIERDDSRGRALPEHMLDSIKNGTSK